MKDKDQEDPEIILKVHTEQIQHLYSQTWIALVSTSVVGLAVCLALWHVVSPWKLVLWFACYLLVSASRIILSLTFQRTSPEGRDIYKWGRLHTAGSGAAGMMWAFASIFLWPEGSQTELLVLPICIVALSGGAIATYYTWTQSYMSFFLPSVLPLSFRLIFEGGSAFVILGLVGLFFIGFLARTGSIIHEANLNALLVRFRNEALNKQLRHEISERKRSQQELRLQNNVLEELNAQLTETKNSLESTNKELENALSEVKKLQGIIPICSHCKKIRDDQGAWQALEGYFRERSDAQFSHGICPDCMGKYYPDYSEDE